MHSKGFAAQLLDILNDRLCDLKIYIADNDVSTLARQLSGNRAANATACARNNGDLVIQRNRPFMVTPGERLALATTAGSDTRSCAINLCSKHAFYLQISATDQTSQGALAGPCILGNFHV